MRNARKGLGLTQLQVAEKAGVTDTLISMLESGERKHPRRMSEIAAAVGKTPAELMFGEPENMTELDTEAVELSIHIMGLNQDQRDAVKNLVLQMTNPETDPDS